MLSGIQKKLIHRFEEYYGVRYDTVEISQDTVQFNTGSWVMIVAYDGLIIYDTKRGIDIRKK